MDEMSAYTQSTHLISGTVKDIGNTFHRTKNQVRRQTFHLENHLKNVTNIWKDTVKESFLKIYFPTLSSATATTGVTLVCIGRTMSHRI